jgi:hypothetical protein
MEVQERQQSAEVIQNTHTNSVPSFKSFLHVMLMDYSKTHTTHMNLYTVSIRGLVC